MATKCAVFTFTTREAIEAQKKVNQLLATKGVEFQTAVQSESSVLNFGGVVVTNITLSVWYTQEND